MPERERMIEREVDRTLQCLDEIEALESSPFFYTRLMAGIRALDERKERACTGILVAKALRSACVTLLVVLNIATAVYLLRHDRPEDRKASVMAFAERYSLFGSSYESTTASGGE